MVQEQPAMKIGEIAKRLGIATDLAQLVVRPLVGTQLETMGAKRATRYYLLGAAPKQRSRSATSPPR